MDATWPASAAVAILMLAQAQLARRQLGGWLAPGALFCLVWTTATIVSLLIAPEYRIWPGVLWIFFMTCTAHLGGALASTESAELAEPEPREPIRRPPRFPLLLPLLCASAVLGSASELYLLHSIGRDFSSVLSLRELSEVSSRLTGARYTDPGYREPTGYLVLQTFVYLGGNLAGVVFAQTRSRTRRGVALVAILPALLGTLVAGAKSVAVGFGMCWIAAYCAVRVYTGYTSPWRSARRAYGAMALALVAFTGFFVVVQSIREDLFEHPFEWATKRDRVVSYSLSSAKNQYVGYIAAFSDWSSRNWDVWETPGLGIYSFDGPAGWFGYEVVRNPEPIQLSPESEASLTNIFSMFRQMALDWTLPGSAVFLFLMSVFATFAYARVRAGSVACIPLTAIFYWIALYVAGFALRSTVTDASWLMFATYLWLACSAAGEPEPAP